MESMEVKESIKEKFIKRVADSIAGQAEKNWVCWGAIVGEPKMPEALILEEIDK